MCLFRINGNGCLILHYDQLGTGTGQYRKAKANTCGHSFLNNHFHSNNMPRGGARKGAGRRTKAEELELPALMDEIFGKDGRAKLLKKIKAQADAGSFAHQQLLLQYNYGKPTEHKKVDKVSEILIEYSDGGSKDLIEPAS